VRPLPRSLGINGSVYTVRRVRRLTPLSGDAFCNNCRRPVSDTAHTDPDRKVISIVLKMPRRAAWVALFHEALHVLEHETNPTAEFSQTIERFIERIDDPLFALLHETFGVGR
jgi:hypothetical protein